METLNSAENLFTKYKNLEKGNLRIICGSTLVNTVLMKPLIKFTNDYPNVSVSVVNDISTNSLEKIATGSADVSIFNMPIKNEYDNIRVDSIAKARMCFFTTKKYYDKVMKGKFSEKDLDKYYLAFPAKNSNSRKELDSKLEQKNIVVEPQYEFSSGKVLVDFVANAGGIGYANTEIIKNRPDEKDLVILTKNFDDGEREIGVAYLNEKITSAAVLKFLDYLKK